MDSEVYTVYPERIYYGLPPGTKERIKAIARERGQTPGEVWREIVRQGMDMLTGADNGKKGR